MQPRLILIQEGLDLRVQVSNYSDEVRLEYTNKKMEETLSDVYIGKYEDDNDTILFKSDIFDWNVLINRNDVNKIQQYILTALDVLKNLNKSYVFNEYPLTEEIKECLYYLAGNSIIPVVAHSIDTYRLNQLKHIDIGEYFNVTSFLYSCMDMEFYGDIELTRSLILASLYRLLQQKRKDTLCVEASTIVTENLDVRELKWCEFVPKGNGMKSRLLNLPLVVFSEDGLHARLILEEQELLRRNLDEGEYSENLENFFKEVYTYWFSYTHLEFSTDLSRDFVVKTMKEFVDTLEPYQKQIVFARIDKSNLFDYRNLERILSKCEKDNGIKVVAMLHGVMEPYAMLYTAILLIRQSLLSNNIFQ